MRILVLSDTHIPVMAKTLPQQVITEASNSQLCLHAGDLVDYTIFEKLSSYTKTLGVCGNMDNEEVRKRLPYKEIVEVEKLRIGIIHGKGAPENLITLINREFEELWDSIQIFVFGHSHQPFCKKIDGKLYFNPGSPTDKVFAPYKSYGILEIKGTDVIKTDIIKLK